jgi:oligopeptide transport system substrate-binding protein
VAASLDHGPTLLAPPGTAGLDEAQALQAAWKSVLGIRVQIDSPDNATYVSDIESGHFEMALLGWNADYDDPTTFLDIFRSGSANNFGGWSDPAFDSALRAAGGASGAARAQHLVAAERELLSQLPVIPLWWPAIATIVRPGVRGLVLLPTGPDYYLGGVRVTQG